MAGSIELWVAHLPGRGALSAQPPFQTLDALVAALLLDLRTIGLLGAPYALFGHSFGALVAYALTQRIVAAEAPPPVALLVSSHAPPDAPLPPAHARLTTSPPPSDVMLLESLSQLGMLDEAVERELRGQTAEALERLLAPLRHDLWLRAEHLLARSSHEGSRSPPRRPLRLPLHVFGGAEDASVSPDELQRWQATQDGGEGGGEDGGEDGGEGGGQSRPPFSLTLLPGSHLYLAEGSDSESSSSLERLLPELSSRALALAAASPGSLLIGAPCALPPLFVHEMVRDRAAAPPEVPATLVASKANRFFMPKSSPFLSARPCTASK